MAKSLKYVHVMFIFLSLFLVVTDASKSTLNFFLYQTQNLENFFSAHITKKIDMSTPNSKLLIQMPLFFI